MPITINGSGTLTGISAGGLPDDSIIAADIAAGAVTTAKVADANITAAKLDGAQTGSAPIYGCRAWVNFDGTKDTTGATSTANTNRLIRASGNVASVLRNAAGDYTITFTTAMADANYSVTAATQPNAGAGPAIGIFASNNAGSWAQAAPTSSAFRVTTSLGGSIGDPANVCISVFR